MTVFSPWPSAGQEASMTSAEAASCPDTPGMAEMIGLLGWPWKLALLLLVAAPACWLLPATGLLAVDIRPWAGAAAAGCAAGAALLALGAGLRALRALLAGPAAAPAASEAQTLSGELRHLLEDQRARMNEATAALGRAVTAGAQLSGLVRAAEKQLREVLERPVLRVAPEGGALPEALRQVVSRMDAELGAAAARIAAITEQATLGDSATLVSMTGALADFSTRLEKVAARLESLAPAATLSRMEQCAARLERLEPVLEALHAATERRSRDAAPIQPAPPILAAPRSLHDDEGGAAACHALGPGQGGCAAMGLAEQLRQHVQSLATHVARVSRNEATLGDAARYLTETTDRFREGTASLEMQAVRLQALISIAGNREA